MEVIQNMLNPICCITKPSNSGVAADAQKTTDLASGMAVIDVQHQGCLSSGACTLLALPAKVALALSLVVFGVIPLLRYTITALECRATFFGPVAFGIAKSAPLLFSPKQLPIRFAVSLATTFSLESYLITIFNVMFVMITLPLFLVGLSPLTIFLQCVLTILPIPPERRLPLPRPSLCLIAHRSPPNSDALNTVSTQHPGFNTLSDDYCAWCRASTPGQAPGRPAKILDTFAKGIEDPEYDPAKVYHGLKKAE